MVGHSQGTVLLVVWYCFPWELLVVVEEEWVVKMVGVVALKVRGPGHCCCQQQASD